jgi:basic membrane protein A
MASPTASSSLRAYVLSVALLATSLVLVQAAGSTARAPFRACLVTAAGGADDPALDRLSVAGLRAAERTGVAGRVLPGTSQADAMSLLRLCAQEGTEITIGVGYGMATAVDQVATEFPRRAFAIVDVDVRGLRHRPANVEGLLFKDQEAGYLAGYAAGLWAKQRGGKAVGSVGALGIPPVERAVAGFRFGATRADPGITTLNGYSGGFAVPAKCEQQALAQIAKGSVVEFQVAGPCGAGVFSAARAKGKAAIGFGADQSSFGPFVLTSALERVDHAVEDAVRVARAGQFPGGVNVTFGVQRGGIGYGAWSPRVPRSIRRAVSAQYELLKAGRITGIPTTLP